MNALALITATVEPQVGISAAHLLSVFKRFFPATVLAKTEPTETSRGSGIRYCFECTHHGLDHVSLSFYVTHTKPTDTYIVEISSFAKTSLYWTTRRFDSLHDLQDTVAGVAATIDSVTYDHVKRESRNRYVRLAAPLSGQLLGTELWPLRVLRGTPVTATVEPGCDTDMNTAIRQATGQIKAAGFRFGYAFESGFRMFNSPVRGDYASLVVDFVRMDDGIGRDVTMSLAIQLHTHNKGLAVNFTGPCIPAENIYLGSWSRGTQACIKWCTELRDAVLAGDKESAKAILLRHAHRGTRLYQLLDR